MPITINRLLVRPEFACSCNGRMRHEAMSNDLSYDVILLKPFYSDSMISVFSYTK